MGQKHGGPRTSCTMEPRGPPPDPEDERQNYSTRYPPAQRGLPVYLPCDRCHKVPPTQWLMCSVSVLRSEA